MDRPSAEDRHDPVAGLLEGQSALDGAPVEDRELDGVRHAEEVGSVQQVDVEGVALDPLAAVEQAAKHAHRGVDGDPGQVLERVDARHLVRDRADPADARDDVEDLVRRPPDDELLEVARRLEDRELRLGHLSVADDQPERSFALDPCQPGDLEPAFVDRRDVRAMHQWSSRLPLATGGPPSESMTSRNGRA